MARKFQKDMTPPLWRERKRNIFGLPWSFTVYRLTEDKLLTTSGFLNKKYDEVMLYRIKDFQLTRSFIQRIFGIGTIRCIADDETTKEFFLVNVRDAEAVKEFISVQVEECRMRKKLILSELVGPGESPFEGAMPEQDVPSPPPID